ncbi:hypothetical protein TGAM01_v205553 [Trichoderma gamsii]|uniref:Flavin-nucleotide-binding protein n=1 Tax=Trichoderma gamsii TaxID=398673 RepID=A0A2P4ZMZ5_9HYPO|nr:hypothetical protein TGAM01_v205553 [Trichoderma gamsii]PON25667.1 hypothetical protein TGAM01_v205553 [Trichoderma gamsii]
MGRHTLEYPKTSDNTVRRHNERATYALSTIHRLINASPIIDVAFNTPDSPFPAVLPMIGQMGSFDRPSADIGDPQDLYIHGYVSARMFNVTKAATTDDQKEEEKGLPVTISASHVDALILATSGFNHSYNYRSVVLFGYATLVEDEEEKKYALEVITNGIVPERWQKTRQPPTKAEMTSTSVLKVRITSGSAKIRDGGVLDDKHDLQNEEAQNSVWTGVLPIYSSVGEPIPTSYNKVEVPSNISDFVKDYNKENKEYALEAAKK